MPVQKHLCKKADKHIKVTYVKNTELGTKECIAIRKQGAGATGWTGQDWQQAFSMLWNCPKEVFSSRSSNHDKSCLLLIGKSISCTMKAELVPFIKKGSPPS